MNSEKNQQICEMLTEMHEGDERQLDVIFSTNNRIIVEAPAGYGKTTTMISRLAYLIATDSVPYPKRILTLTFSVNAALKVKRDVAEKLPILLGKQNNPNYVSSKLTITNYHGFCKGVLKKYGYLLSGFLKNLDDLQAIGDEDISKLADTKALLDANEQLIISEVSNIIMQLSLVNEETFWLYNDIIAKKLFPVGKITHNAIILLTLQLFKRHSNILNFYQKYFSLLVIDEYQDTNIIAWMLVHRLIGEDTKLLLMGDSLQRIYGFIGAYPNIMSISATHYNMETISLDKNYRFRNNPEMLKLDNNIRKNAINFNSPNITENASLPYYYSITQDAEGLWIAKKVKTLLKKNPVAKVAVLVKNRGINTDIIEENLQKEQIDYFYALYKDDDEDYIEFHRTCLNLFSNSLGKSSNVSRNNLNKFVDKVKGHYANNDNKIYQSLLDLLDVLIEKVIVDYGGLEPEDRKSLLMDIFENRQLKQAMEYVPSNTTLSTVHGAKGLEWDYVILADAERFIMPFFNTCKYCGDHHFGTTDELSCHINKPIDQVMERMLLEELCVFYVAITRARKQVYITSSSERFNATGRRFDNSVLGCLSQLKGIVLCNEPLAQEDSNIVMLSEEQLKSLKEEADMQNHLEALGKSSAIVEKDVFCCDCGDEYICIDDNYAPIGVCLNCGTRNHILYCSYCQCPIEAIDIDEKNEELYYCSYCNDKLFGPD